MLNFLLTGSASNALWIDPNVNRL